jgi:membrane dipeptidase
MAETDLHPMFDGHNDVLLRLFLKKTDDPVKDFILGDGEGHLDLPRILRGRMGGGLFAIFVPNGEANPASDDDLNPPLAGGVPFTEALPKALTMASLLLRIERSSFGRFKICRTAQDIKDCLAKGVVAAVMHMEGAEAIDEDFCTLEVLHAAGLRSLGPVWSRPNAFGHGVPFRFPSSPDTGPGLTEAGKSLVRYCNQRGILVDLSHITERGFWDVAKISTAPLVATHSNAHSLSASSRNLTDEQVAQIGRTRGMIGLNFANGFLRRDGGWSNDTSFATMIAHLDHLMAIAGEDCVGLGSDFDGARIPREIGTVLGLPNLQNAMRAHGYSDTVIRKLCHGNWLRVLELTWGA